MNKIRRLHTIVKEESSYETYTEQILKIISRLQGYGLEVEVQYGDKSTCVIGRKHEYSAEELL